VAEQALPGAVIMALLPLHQPAGHEQQGARPVVLVGMPEELGKPRFPTVFVTPLTTDRGQTWAAASPRLYLRIPAGAGGVPVASIALLDQSRALDVRRLGDCLGSLEPDVFTPIREGLARILAGGPAPAGDPPRLR